jgi:hypothetical protein
VVLLERPRVFLGTRSTNKTDYEVLVEAEVSGDALGLSYLTLAIDPDPNAFYKIHLGSLMSVTELELTAVWSLMLPHLTYGYYAGFKAGDKILIAHRSKDPTVTVKTGFTLAFNEVVI